MSKDEVLENKKRSKFDSIEKQKCKFMGSARMVYTICAFLALVFHNWLRNTMNFLVLCMVKPNDELFNVTIKESITNGICEINGDSTDVMMQKTGNLEWSRDEEFLMLSSLYYGYIIVMPVAGYLCDKFGSKVFFVHTLTIQAILFILTPQILHWSYKAGFLARILQGIISGFGTPPIYKLFSVWAHPSELTATMSFAFGGFSVGTVLAYPISGQFCRLGWEVSFYAVGAFIFLISSTFQWLVYDTLEAHPRLSKEEYDYLKSCSIETSKAKIPWICLLKSVPIHAFNLTHLFHSYGIILFTIILPKMLKETMGFSVTETSYYSMFPYLGGILSKTVTSCFWPIERKYKNNLTCLRRIVYVICNVLTVCCLLGIVFSNCLLKYLVVVLIFLLGFVTDIAFSTTYWPSLIFVAPSFSGLISGIANCFANLAGVIAPILTAVIVKEGSKEEWNIILYTIIGSYIMAASVYGCFGSSKQTSWGKVPAKVLKKDQSTETEYIESDYSYISHL